MKLAEAYVELRLDSKKAEAEGRAQVTSMGKELGSTFGQIFGVAAFAGGIAKSIGAASDLNETVSKTQVIFGQSGDAVTKWADNSAKQFGLSKTAALDAVGTFAVFGKGAGLAGDDLTKFSEKLVGLSSDLASFYNTSPEQAIEAIGAALRGEAEPIRQYGVLLDDATLKQRAMSLGLYDGTGALDQHSRVLAAQAEILAQTTQAQGDFARTADGAANSQRIAKAEAENGAASLGQKFLPIYKQAVKVVGALADGFGDLPAPIQLGIVGMAGFLALAGPATKMYESVTKLGGSLKKLLANVGPLQGAALGIGVVAGAFVAAFSVQETQQDRVTKATERYVKAIQAATDGTKEAIQQQIQADISQGNFLDTVDKLGLKAGDVAKVITGQSVPAYEAVRAKLDEILDPARSGDQQVRQLSEAFGIGIGQAQGFVDRIDVLTKGLASGKVAAAEAEAVTRELTGAIGVATGATADLTDKQANQLADGEKLPELIKSTADAQKDAAAKTVDLTDKWSNQTKTGDDLAGAYEKLRKDGVDRLIESVKDEVTVFDQLATSADELRKAIDVVFGGSISMEEADRAAQDAKAKLTQAVKDNGVTLDINTEKGRANRSQIQESVKAILDYATAQVGAGKSIDDARASVQFMTADLRNQLEQAGFTKDEIDSYLTTLGLTPENVTTAIELAGNEHAKAEIEARQSQLDGLSQGAVAEIQALVDAGKYQEALALLDELTKDRTVNVNTTFTGKALNPGEKDVHRSASGRFVPRNANLLSTIAEPGAGDEAVLPLQQRSRLVQLLSDPRIGGPVADAMGDAGGMTVSGGTTLTVFPNATITNTVDLDGAFRAVNFLLAGAGL